MSEIRDADGRIIEDETPDSTGVKESDETGEHAMEVMADVIENCIGFIERNYSQLWGDNLFWKEDVVRNARLILDLRQCGKLSTVCRNKLSENKLASLKKPRPL